MTETPAHRTFSPTEAALEGFRMARERPRVLLVWAAVNLIVSVAVWGLLISLFGSTLAELEAMSGQADNPEQAMAIADDVLRLYAVVLPIGLLAMAVFSAAVYRVVLRPAHDRYAYLRLGRDELRLVLLALIYFVLITGATFVVAFISVLLAEGAAAVSGPAGRLLGLLILVGAFGFLIFAAVRLSLAGPMTFAEGQLRIFESWRLTRGNFWRLFAAYILAIILIIIVFLLGLIIYAALAAIVSGDLATAGQIIQPEAETLGGLLSPAMIIYLIFGALYGALQNAVIYAPGAIAYQQLSGDGAATGV